MLANNYFLYFFIFVFISVISIVISFLPSLILATVLYFFFTSLVGFVLFIIFSKNQLLVALTFLYCFSILYFCSDLFISFLLLGLESFSNFLVKKARLFIGDLCFLMKTFTAINFLLSTALDSHHRFCYAMFFISIHLKVFSNFPCDFFSNSFII